MRSAVDEQGQKRRNRGIFSNVKDRIIHRKCHLLFVSLTYLKLLLYNKYDGQEYSLKSSESFSTICVKFKLLDDRRNKNVLSERAKWELVMKQLHQHIIACLKRQWLVKNSVRLIVYSRHKADIKNKNKNILFLRLWTSIPNFSCFHS